MTAQQIWTQIVEHAPVPDVHVRIGSDTSAGRVALIETVEVPGMEPPYHRHLESDILIYVVAGELTLYLAGAAIAAPAGSAHWVPCVPQRIGQLWGQCMSSVGGRDARGRIH